MVLQMEPYVAGQAWSVDWIVFGGNWQSTTYTPAKDFSLRCRLTINPTTPITHSFSAWVVESMPGEPGGTWPGFLSNTSMCHFCVTPVLVLPHVTPSLGTLHSLAYQVSSVSDRTYGQDIRTTCNRQLMTQVAGVPGCQVEDHMPPCNDCLHLPAPLLQPHIPHTTTYTAWSSTAAGRRSPGAA